MINYFITGLFFTTLIHASETFKIHPYWVKADNQRIFLKYKTHKNQDLVIKTYTDEDYQIPNITIYKTSKKNELISINLGRQECDQTLFFSIEFEQNSRVLIKKKLPAFKCRSHNKFTFGLISDTQKGHAHHKMMARLIKEKLKKYEVQFVLHTGDITHRGGLYHEWIDFFDAAKKYLEQTPIVASVGNHAYYKDESVPLPNYFKQYMRWNNAEQIGYYKLDFPNFYLIVLNSTFEKLTAHQIEKQYNWLRENLKLAQMDRKPVIVGMHYPPFSSSFFTASPQAIYLRRKFVPLFEKYGVKMVLTGHTHLYERSFKNGVFYIISGPLGGTRAIPTGFNPKKVSRKSLARTFSLISIEDNKIQLKVYAQHDKVIDSLDILY
jgi:predicted phosphodiesterase